MTTYIYCLLLMSDMTEQVAVNKRNAIKAIDKTSIQKICCGQVIVDLCSAVKEVCFIIILYFLYFSFPL